MPPLYSNDFTITIVPETNLAVISIPPFPFIYYDAIRGETWDFDVYPWSLISP